MRNDSLLVVVESVAFRPNLFLHLVSPDAQRRQSYDRRELIITPEMHILNQNPLCLRSDAGR